VSIKLNEFFNKVSSEKTMLTTAAKGIDFEHRLINKLISVGFNRMLRDESIELDTFLNKIKPIILQKFGDNLIENTLIQKGNQYKDIIVWQPYSQQNYPDILIFTEYLIFSLEIKYTMKFSHKPKWNGNLPKSNGLYIFGSYGDRDITFFRGEDVLPEATRLRLLEYPVRIQTVHDEWTNEFLNDIEDGGIENEYGFFPYNRMDWDQKQYNMPYVILNFLRNGNRPIIENNLLNFITKVNINENNNQYFTHF